MNPTPKQAKNIVASILKALELPAYRLTARTVSFLDLARDTRIFVKIHGWKPDCRWDVIRENARGCGFSIET